MTTVASLFGFRRIQKMALPLLLIMATSALSASTNVGEMALANITRLASGDIFSLVGTDCGPTRCMEISHGTALAAMGGDGCMCKCRRDTPAFREDQRTCVNHVDECSMATFGRGASPQIPFVFLPLKGQIVYPSKEIIFTDVKDAVCGVVSAQYLSPSGWVTLRDVIDNDVPFSVYRDEGSTFLQWRGSAGLHSRLEGRLVVAHVLCSTPEQQVASSCAAFRIAGASHTSSLLDVRSIPFHAGETVTPEPTQNQGLSVLESLAIGVCALMLLFIYAAGIIFYVHYKQRQKRREKDPEDSNSMENGSMDSRIDMDDVQLKTNPLLGMGNLNAGFCHDSGLSDVSEHTEETLDSSPNNTQKFQKPNTNVIAAMVHNRRKKPTRPSLRASNTPERISERLQRRSASPDILERAPHSDLSVVDCSLESNSVARQPFQSSNGEPALRKKLYFNPVFFETEHLKNPPPAAIEFLMKIREVMSIAKDKMTSKRFVPMLSDIPEEDPYHSIDLGWDIPCARHGRRFSAISLKQENSRRAVHCGGCPGCDSNVKTKKAVPLTRSNSCKTCVSDDYKQRIVRKWLDEVPSPSPSIKTIKSVAKVSGTPRILEAKLKSDIVRPRSAEPIKSEQKGSMTLEPKQKQQCANVIKRDLKEETFTTESTREIDNTNKNNLTIKHNDDKVGEPMGLTTPIKMQEKNIPSNHISRRIRKKLPPPPPPPMNPPETMKGEDEEEVPILPEVKLKMEAVIRELNKCRRLEPKEIEEVKLETVTPIAPKIVIPVIAADSHYYSDDNMIANVRRQEQFTRKDNFNIEMDSLDRSMIQKRRRFSLACSPELTQRNILEFQQRMPVGRSRLTSSWRDLKKEYDDENQIPIEIVTSRVANSSEIFINVSEPIYDNIQTNLGPLTIKVSGSPVESRRYKVYEDFDPDTLDRKPKREPSKRVEKILLKSAGSFKLKVPAPDENDNKVPPPPTVQSPPEEIFNRKIGSLREIYEMKTKAQNNEMQFYNRRGSIPFNQDVIEFVKSLKTPDLIRQLDGPKDPKPPIPPKQRRSTELSPKFSSSFRDSPSGDRRRILEERDRFHQYARAENINARRSGRRSARTRSRRTDLRKLYRTEDSGYMSTDSNESKRRAKYLMHLRPKVIPEPVSVARSITRTPILPMESDTDDLESICDGRSESGGESVETDSVFFGNFDDTKEMFAELGLGFDLHRKINNVHEQIDSGFMGETNIILSGDSDSEHRSVISIITGRDGRTSSASITKLDDPPYIHSVEC